GTGRSTVHRRYPVLGARMKQKVVNFTPDTLGKPYQSLRCKIGLHAWEKSGCYSSLLLPIGIEMSPMPYNTRNQRSA
ncbi:MAG: hypothetical protein KGL39_28445, partial [Patescibacteria group bacterium]|nr:hypothetical protein [Patescibacteria group bacterium]